ncbi:MAG: rhodanese-like domain-containing protein [Oligoflexia bacterium]|nr:rhodanese-like domain-containing protein [Oligoflexia bacterium]
MFESYQNYLILILIGLFFAWKAIKTQRNRRKVPGLLARGGIIIDVRTKNEFDNGSAPRSINIPLDKIEQKLKTMDPKTPIILCCASGARSGFAARIFKRHGFKEIVNVGSWTNINIHQG